MKVSRLGTMAVVTGMVLALAVGAAVAGDWPQFLGPDRNATSKETGLARSWPESGPPVLWTNKTGIGYGGAVVLGDEVFILDRDSDGGKDTLRCLSLATGEDKWSYSYSAPGKFSHNGSRSVPAVDANNVYTVGALGDFYCVSRKTHKPVWKKQLLRDFGGKKPMWVVAQSPLLYKDMVIVAPQGRSAGVIACDRATGEIKWKTPALGSGMNYCSPTIATIGGTEQIVTVTGERQSQVTGIDASNGKVLWTYTGWSCRIAITSATVIGDGRLFITGEYGAGSAMIKVTASGTKFKAEELYKTQVCGSQIHQPLLYEGHLYMHSNGNKRNDGLLCITLDGKPKWKSNRSPNFGRGGLILADGLIISMEGTDGVLHLIEPSPDGLKIISKVKLLGGKEIWAPLALSNGKLIIRDQNQIKCLDISAK